MQKDALHHSRLLSYRSPQGAVTSGREVALRLWTNQRLNVTNAVLRLWMNDHEERFPMSKAPGDEGTWFEAIVRTPDEPGLVWYYFILERSNAPLLIYGGESGEGGIFQQDPQGYQITVYDQAFTTPRWFREGIVYQIFPDRFARSCDPEQNSGIAYHRGMGRRVRVHAQWEEQPEYLPEQGQRDYMPNDFFCGDLWGVLHKLPYLQSLGINCIYLNPVLKALPTIATTRRIIPRWTPCSVGMRL